jgi:hypothetical protein
LAIRGDTGRLNHEWGYFWGSGVHLSEYKKIIFRKKYSSCKLLMTPNHRKTIIRAYQLRIGQLNGVFPKYPQKVNIERKICLASWQTW